MTSEGATEGLTEEQYREQARILRAKADKLDALAEAAHVCPYARHGSFGTMVSNLHYRYCTEYE